MTESYHMRRKDKAIEDPATLRRILGKAKHITVAMCKDGMPYLVSLSHGYDEEQDLVYFHCAPEGKKLDYMRANPTIWGQAVLDFGFFDGHDDCRQEFASVMFQGEVTFVEDPEEKLHAFVMTNKQLDAPSEGLQRVLDEHLERATVGKIRMSKLTGKKTKGVEL
jgi:nitroimidazol reductase NimA-like FMN-containing flavoprotein (pyridoxamine 5'-phosphate oxidase superfamily)